MIQVKNNGFYAFFGAKSIVKSANFPRFCGKKQKFRYFYILGIGGNIGDTRRRFERLYRLLGKHRKFWIVETSCILKNSAFGYTLQDDFLNALICVQSSLNPSDALKIMQKIELKFGRKRSFKNAPRTLDIDILYANVMVRKTARLQVPHPGANERISVIFPLGMCRSLNV